MDIFVGGLRLPVRFHPRRRRLAVIVTAQGIEVRAPEGCSRALIERFVQTQSTWIEQMAEAHAERQYYLWGAPVVGVLPDSAARAELMPWLQQRLAYWQDVMGVRVGKVRVRRLKSRWGSCSSQGNLSFSLHLAQLPKPLVDYVVVHELAHLREMSHSPAFWAEVAAVMPDYGVRRQQMRVWAQKIAF